MVVMWKEKPIASSFNNRRTLFQPGVSTSRLLFFASSRFRTIMCIPLLRRCPVGLVEHGPYRTRHDVETAYKLFVGNRQRRQALHDLVVTAARFYNQSVS